MSAADPPVVDSSPDLRSRFSSSRQVLAELGGRPVEGDGVALQEELHLLADALVVAGGEEDLDAVEQAVAGQGDAERLPGPVVGLVQRLRQRAAVVAEPLLDVPTTWTTSSAESPITCRSPKPTSCVTRDTGRRLRAGRGGTPMTVMERRRECKQGNVAKRGAATAREKEKTAPLRSRIVYPFKIASTTTPPLMVGRSSRPLCGSVRRRWSRPRQRSMVACRSWTWVRPSTAYSPMSSVAP